MKVSELIEKLEELPQDLHVYVPNTKDEVFPEYQLANNVNDIDMQIEDDMEIGVCVIE